MNDPLPVIPLEYATSEGPRRRWQHTALKFLILGSYLLALAAWLLIILIDVESVMATGPILGLVGILMTIFAVMVSHFPSLFVSLAQISICGLFWSLVLMFHWSPQTAEMPFITMGGVYLAISLWLSVRAELDLKRFYAIPRQ